MQIIAGPIIRHANKKEINIWIVLDSRAENINGEVVGKMGQVLGSTKADSHEPIQAGKNAFVYLLKLLPSRGFFSTETILNYDIIIDDKRLVDFGLTKGDDDNSITYEGETLPGLVLKEKHQVILQGSCRKPHASISNKSQPDMLVTSDALMQSNKQNVAKRPSLLFLTGDQIYADDVVAPMLAIIKDAVRQYIGHDEAIPISEGANIQVSSLELNGRANLLSARNMGFSSTQKDNHLLSFGEYFMMYCFVWGGLEAKCPNFCDIKNELKQEALIDDTDELDNQYWTEKLIVKRFLRDARKVRRLLANVPTYMIFDDHDVSDDWNLDAGNHAAFRNHIFSRHVQTNALTAYWLCQGWGNTPDVFEPPFKDTVRQYLDNYPQEKFSALENALLDHYWGYEIDSYPYMVVLDTRTKREYNDNKLAKLMKPETLAEVASRIKAVPDAKKTGNSLLLISAAPVYGFTQMESKQLALSEACARALDVECWIADDVAFKQLQTAVLDSGFNCCAIFSGDVHYGFVRHENLVSGAGKPVRIFQLTSSSLHNAPSCPSGFGLELLSIEAFKKDNTHYLLPKDRKIEFLNRSTNIGILELDDGQPQVFTLNSEITSLDQAFSWLGKEKGFSWVYDLNNPQRL